jgi:hypothetical protein
MAALVSKVWNAFINLLRHTDVARLALGSTARRSWSMAIVRVSVECDERQAVTPNASVLV